MIDYYFQYMVLVVDYQKNFRCFGWLAHYTVSCGKHIPVHTCLMSVCIHVDADMNLLNVLEHFKVIAYVGLR